MTPRAEAILQKARDLAEEVATDQDAPNDEAEAMTGIAVGLHALVTTALEKAPGCDPLSAIASVIVNLAQHKGLTVSQTRDQVFEAMQKHFAAKRLLDAGGRPI